MAWLCCWKSRSQTWHTVPRQHALYGVDFIWKRLSCQDITALKDSCCITKDEINNSDNITFTVELVAGVCTTRVLESLERAAVHDGVTTLGVKGHRLVFFSPAVLKNFIYISTKLFPRTCALLLLLCKTLIY